MDMERFMTMLIPTLLSPLICKILTMIIHYFIIKLSNLPIEMTLFSNCVKIIISNYANYFQIIFLNLLRSQSQE